MYSAQHGESVDMQHDPLESGHDLELRSRLVFDLFGSNYASFEVERRDDQIGTSRRPTHLPVIRYSSIKCIRSTVNHPEVIYGKNSQYLIKISFYDKIKSNMINVCKNHCHHRVRLVVPLRMMHNLTQKGQIQDLTLGQGHDLA